MSKTSVNPIHNKATDSHSVTTVRPSAAEDRHHREMQYLLAMGLRIVCIIIAVAVPGPIRWVAVAGAMFLPWFAVMIANNTGAPARVRVDPGPSSALSAGPSARPATPSSPEPRMDSGYPTIVIDDTEAPLRIGPARP